MPLARQLPWERQKTTAHCDQEKALNEHKADRLKTIILPVVLSAVVLFLGAGGALYAMSGAGLHKFASAVLILTSALCILSGLALLIVLLGAIYLTARLTASVPQATSTLLDTLEAARRSAEGASLKTASPFLKAKSTAAAVKAFIKTITSKKPHQQGERHG